MEKKKPFTTTQVPLLVLLIIYGILYFQTVHFEFTNFDDPELFLKNPDLSPIQWFKIWFSKSGFDYLPVTLTTLAIEKSLFGFEPALFHLTQLIICTLNVLLVYFFLRSVTQDREISILIAGLFALHPLNSEVVSWITARKDALNLTFMLLGLTHAASCKSIGIKNQIFILGAFVLALGAKPIAVVFPVLLVCILYFQRKPLPQVLLLIMTALCGASLATQWGAQGASTHLAQGSASIGSHLIDAGQSYLFYFSKIIFPLWLSPHYPKNGEGLFLTEYILAVFGIIGLVASFLVTKNRRLFVFGVVWFFVCLLPTSQIIPFGNHFAFANRYFYIGGIGILLALMTAIPKRILFHQFFLIPLACLMLFWSWQSWSYSSLWRNSETLWRGALLRNEKNPTAYFNLGGYYLFERSSPKQALVEYVKALALNPKDAPLRFNIGMALEKIGQTREAIGQFELARELAPQVFQIHLNLSVLYQKVGSIDRAQQSISKALELNPSSVEVQNQAQSLKVK
ncbi:MAG: tetratricopeptide repeat protein [Oligoflexia bacterium]|nr:tetratricopeptide repeat protein [Oligoflexia bacterium]